VKNNRRLAFIDLDGTLLGPDKTVGVENRAALDRLRKADVQIVIASGRHHRNIAALAGIGEPGWILSSQGAVVRHEQTGEILRELTMQPATVEQISDRARATGVSLVAYHREGAHIEQSSHWTDFYARQTGWVPRTSNLRALPTEGFQKIIWTAEASRIDALTPPLVEEFGDRYQIVVTDPEFLEFLAPGANKAAGAQVLAERLGVDASSAMAFGDGNNDVELLGWAGISVAMRHGRKSAQSAARFVSADGPPESAFARAVDLALQA
jgi:Cof subfamily protein (haloacid dehalogenase superfamily)